LRVFRPVAGGVLAGPARVTRSVSWPMSLTASCSNIFLATGTGFSYRPATFPREQRTGASAIGSAQVCRRWSGGLPVPVMSFPTPRKGGTSMAR